MPADRRASDAVVARGSLQGNAQQTAVIVRNPGFVADDGDRERVDQPMPDRLGSSGAVDPPQLAAARADEVDRARGHGESARRATDSNIRITFDGPDSAQAARTADFHRGATHPIGRRAPGR